VPHEASAAAVACLHIEFFYKPFAFTATPAGKPLTFGVKRPILM